MSDPQRCLQHSPHSEKMSMRKPSIVADSMQDDGGDEVSFRNIQRKFSFRICIRCCEAQESKLSLKVLS